MWFNHGSTRMDKDVGRGKERWNGLGWAHWSVNLF